MSDIDAALEEHRQIGGELRVSAYLNIGAPNRLELVPDVVEVAPYRYETDAEVATRLLASNNATAGRIGAMEGTHHAI